MYLDTGILGKGETSKYTYNALGVRTKNVQTRGNRNKGHMNSLLNNGSLFLEDYMPVLIDGRADWQRVFETEVGTTVQNNFETVTKEYVVDYLSEANRDIMVYEQGSYVQRYVYGQDGERISAEFTYAEGTRRGEPGENLASDNAESDVKKLYYRRSLLDSTLFAVDEHGDVISHMVCDEWGAPLSEGEPGANYAGVDNLSNFTGYTYDEVLGLYFAQNRFYDPETHRFTQEDPIKDSANWYAYCRNNPTVQVDFDGLATKAKGKKSSFDANAFTASMGSFTTKVATANTKPAPTVKKKNTAKTTQTAKPKNTRPATSKASHITTQQAVKNVKSAVSKVQNSIKPSTTSAPPQTSLITQGWNDLGPGGKVARVQQSQSASTESNFVKACCLIIKEKADLDSAIIAGVFTSLEDNLLMSQIETWGPAIQKITGIDSSNIPHMWERVKVQIEENNQKYLAAYLAGRVVTDGGIMAGSAVGMYAGAMAIKAGATTGTASGQLVRSGAGAGAGMVGLVVSGGVTVIGLVAEEASVTTFAVSAVNFNRDIARIKDSLDSQQDNGSLDEGYRTPEGGGGVTNSIQIGQTKVTFGHGGRHLDGSGLSVQEVEEAIARQVAEKPLKSGEFFKGEIHVRGTAIEYTSFGRGSGMVNVGTYYIK